MHCRFDPKKAVQAAAVLLRKERKRMTRLRLLIEGVGRGVDKEEILQDLRDAGAFDRFFSRHTAALSEALADMEAGDHGIPLEEFDRKFRQRHSIPPGA